MTKIFGLWQFFINIIKALKDVEQLFPQQLFGGSQNSLEWKKWALYCVFGWLIKINSFSLISARNFITRNQGGRREVLNRFHENYLRSSCHMRFVIYWYIFLWWSGGLQNHMSNRSIQKRNAICGKSMQKQDVQTHLKRKNTTWMNFTNIRVQA